MTVRWTEEQYAAYTRVRQGHPSGITEGVWQAAILELFKGTGHTLVYHTHDSRRSPHGWPDVAAIKPAGGTLYLCELKTDAGQVTPAQQAWLTALAGCTGVVAEVWKPSALDEIVQRLRGARL